MLEKTTHTRKRETEFGLWSRTNFSGDCVGFRERSAALAHITSDAGCTHIPGGV